MKRGTGAGQPTQLSAKFRKAQLLRVLVACFLGTLVLMPSSLCGEPPMSTPTAEPMSTQTAKPTSPATPIPTRLPWGQSSAFLLGMNYPWKNYGNDFGANAWGAYGVHDPATRAAIDADFATMARTGVDSVRWFVFADGRAGIRFDAEGMPVGIDNDVLPDLDAAVSIAQQHHIGLNLVLLDFTFMSDARYDNDVQMGGHANVINNPAGQTALVERVFLPVIEHLAGNPTILSWEIMNEPEWAISESGSVDKQISQPARLANFQHFARLVVEAVHQHSTSYVTIGSASIKWLQYWTGLDLDYYQVHYYDWMRTKSVYSVFGRTTREINVDRPVVIGEFPASGSETASLAEYLDTWLKDGFAGAWAWSFRANDGEGTPTLPILHTWSIQNSAEMPDAP